ncbi:hypothetical protein [Xanthomonas campestris]|uniref:hypothetical protein n=1 Tax=Xanthomonas campestris TaxID=339 RepID=UPI0011C07996|nr:hypothetical protein [Xanthomonas campestris]MEA9573677.1 hypothetical protein [Xanthomonas campestris]
MRIKKYPRRPSGILRRASRSAPTSAGTAAENPNVLKVRFGKVTVEVQRTGQDAVRRNIQKGHEVMLGVEHALLRPGIDLKVERGVPLYHADPTRPELIVRHLNGETKTGRFINGQFEPQH